ncbi:hypothetical protein [Candidatus Parabeggiatoa sp. HSG14]|uniref:hypothetical protein n=1 Tax=Candidatus Parabeggiatoa sp. HSG14 TaxID=3055593 RepID=UPI0025A7195E|nr:hypothetical protein [Thiotrichales bacterium HSG14]
MKTESFFTREGKNKDYENIRLDDGISEYFCSYDPDEIRDFIKQLWTQYQGYNDKKFLSNARNEDFNGRFWEMYLTCSLLELGINVEKKSNSTGEGPDIKIKEGAKTYWIEAIAPDIGESLDVIQALEFKESIRDVPDNEMTLRLLEAVIRKTKDRFKYIKKGILSEHEPYIIAINSLKLGHFPDFEPPRLIRGVLGIGMPIVQVNLKSGKFTDGGFSEQKSILKRKKSQELTVIPKTFFINRDFYDGISALLYSDINPYNCTPPFFDSSKDLMGDNFYLLHNPRAKNPLPHGFIKLGKEYWVDTDRILQVKHWYKDSKCNTG